MTEWFDVALTDLGTVERGRSRHRPRNDPQLFGGDVPFFQTGDVKAAVLHMTSASQHYSDLGVAQSRVWNAGTTCITIAANIAETAILGRKGCFPDSILGFTPTRGPHDGYFVKYLLDVHRRELTSTARGTTQDNLSLEKLLSYRFRVPQPEAREQIARILRSFDELIENNQRRIVLLEQMAQTIYREWFVHFRFPGSEAATFVHTPFGSVPNGWTISPLHEVAKVVRGRSYRKHELVEIGGVPFVNLKCMERGGGFRRDGLKRYDGRFDADQRVVAGDVVLAVTDLTQGREILARATRVPNLYEEFGVISLDVVRIVPEDPEDRLAILFALGCTDFAERVKEFANGSTVLHLSPKHVAAALVVWPAMRLRREFIALVQPIIKLIDELYEAEVILDEFRDQLLSRLISGEVDVSEIGFDDVAEPVT